MMALSVGGCGLVWGLAEVEVTHIGLIESAGLVGAVVALVLVVMRGRGRLPRDAWVALIGVVVVGLLMHLSAVIEWSGEPGMDPYVDLSRVATPLLWVFFVYALAGELMTEDLQREEHRRTTMMRELDHRVKNNLTTVISLAQQTVGAARDLGEFEEAFIGRVRALGRAHEALAAAKWEGIDLEEIVRLTLRPYERSGGDSARRVKLEGERVMLPARASGAVCMTLHELATNAMKYGALSRAEGTVSVRWEVEEDVVQIDWEERGGPRVEQVEGGLGTELIQGIIAYELGGEVKLEPGEDGVRWRLLVPLEGEVAEFTRVIGSRLTGGSLGADAT